MACLMREEQQLNNTSSKFESEAVKMTRLIHKGKKWPKTSLDMQTDVVADLRKIEAHVPSASLA